MQRLHEVFLDCPGGLASWLPGTKEIVQAKSNLHNVLLTPNVVHWLVLVPDALSSARISRGNVNFESE